MQDHGQRKFGPLGTIAAIAIAAPLAAASFGPAGAAEKIKLTIISGNTQNFAPIGAAIKSYLPKVDEILARTGKYKISWIKGFGGQIVKVRGELDGVEAGLGDLGVVRGRSIRPSCRSIRSATSRRSPRSTSRSRPPA